MQSYTLLTTATILTVLLTLQNIIECQSIGNEIWNIGPNQLPMKIAYGCIITTENNIVYLFGGRIPGQISINSTLKYDTQNSNEWIILDETSSSYASEPFFCFSQNAVYNKNNKLVYIMEPSYTSKIFIFNTLTDEYIDNHNIPPVPFDLGFSCSAIDIDRNIIYLFGAFDSSSNSHLEILNLTSNQWINETDIKQTSSTDPLGGSACIVYNNYFYTFGGDAVGTSTSIIHRYDIDNNIWIECGHLQQSKFGSYAVQSNGDYDAIYIFGGLRTASPSAMNSYETFNPMTNTPDGQINNLTLDSNYGYSIGVVINHRIIIWGGFSVSGYTTTKYTNKSVMSSLITKSPTLSPTMEPTVFPTTSVPTTSIPTSVPVTNIPTENPMSPSFTPTVTPTIYPSVLQTVYSNTDLVTTIMGEDGEDGNFLNTDLVYVIVVLTLILLLFITCIIIMVIYTRKKSAQKTKTFNNKIKKDNKKSHVSMSRVDVNKPSSKPYHHYLDNNNEQRTASSLINSYINNQGLAAISDNDQFGSPVGLAGSLNTNLSNFVQQFNGVQSDLQAIPPKNEQQYHNPPKANQNGNDNKFLSPAQNHHFRQTSSGEIAKYVD